VTSWSSAKDYVNQCSDIITDRYINEILSLFKDKNEFIRFHNLDDGNLYLDTKEEEAENIQAISSHIIENFIDENNYADYSQITSEKIDELVEKLLKPGIITQREIAGLCNLSLSRVFEISKRIKMG